jgi:hypothetical protein
MLKNGYTQRKFPLFGPPQAMERYSDDVFRSYIDQILAHSGSFPALQADSSRGAPRVRIVRGSATSVIEIPSYYSAKRLVARVAALGVEGA